MVTSYLRWFIVVSFSGQIQSNNLLPEPQETAIDCFQHMLEHCFLGDSFDSVLFHHYVLEICKKISGPTTGQDQKGCSQATTMTHPHNSQLTVSIYTTKTSDIHALTLMLYYNIMSVKEYRSTIRTNVLQTEGQSPGSAPWSRSAPQCIGVFLPMLHTSTKWHEKRAGSFCVILLTDRQKKRQRKHNLLGRGK